MANFSTPLVGTFTCFSLLWLFRSLPNIPSLEFIYLDMFPVTWKADFFIIDADICYLHCDKILSLSDL